MSEERNIEFPTLVSTNQRLCFVPGLAGVEERLAFRDIAVLKSPQGTQG